MKAIGIKMIELHPMTATEARNKGYRVPDDINNNLYPGYEVTYKDGYKSWTPKDVADNAYLILDDDEGNKLTPKDIDEFIIDVESQTIGDKTTLVQVTTRTGFEYIEASSCVDPKNYNQELGSKYAIENVKNKLWQHLGFVLQWAVNGLKN